MAGTIHDLDWLFAIGTLFFCLSVWSLGANDVANSYSTSVSSGSLSLPQAGVLAVITEFVGAIALGQSVTGTIRSGIFSVKPFKNSPGVLILGMVCAEVGSGVFQTIATRFGFPVSTTQSIVGALVGVGIAADIKVNWGWKKGSISQIAASWGIAPSIAAAFGALIFLSIKLLVLKRADPLKWGLRLIPFYFGITGGIFALFITISGGHGIPPPKKLGARKATAIVLGSFAASLLISYVFFMPYFYRRLIKEDRRLRIHHVILGPLLWKEDCWIPFPGAVTDYIVPDYYKRRYEGEVDPDDEELKIVAVHPGPSPNAPVTVSDEQHEYHEKGDADITPANNIERPVGRAEGKKLEEVDKLPFFHPRKLVTIVNYVLFRGLLMDVITHQSKGLAHVHARAPRYENKVEHLWTAAQVASAMIMSISHGANDVSNAIGPFTTEYETWKTGVASATTDTPTWIKAVGGLGLGFGFWTYGYHLMRTLGNKITQISPIRGYSMELGTAITVLMATQLGLPISTTQCITGAILGVALMNWDLKSVHWKQVIKIFSGWVITLPSAGLIAGILMGMALNVPHWGPR